MHAVDTRSYSLYHKSQNEEHRTNGVSTHPENNNINIKHEQI